MTMTTYVVTVNMPGYMPESEPAICDTLQDAWDLFKAEVEDTLGLLDMEDPRRGDQGLPHISEVPLERSILFAREFSWMAGGYAHTITQSKPYDGIKEGRTVWSTDEGWAINPTRGEYRCAACLPVGAVVDPDDEVRWTVENTEPGDEPDFWTSRERLKAQGVDLTVDTPQHCYLCDVLIELPLSPEGLDYVFLQVYDPDSRHDSAAVRAWEQFYEDKFPQCERCDERFANQKDLDEHKPEHWSVKTQRQAEEAFEEWVNETYPEIEFPNVTIYPAEALKTDRDAYREQFLNWADAQGVDLDILPES